MRHFAALFAAVVATAAPGAWAAEAPPSAPSTSPSAPEAAKKAVEEHIEAKTREGQGAYRLQDDQTGEQLELVYEATAIVAAGAVWSVHDRARAFAASDYYACSTFHPAHGSTDRRYDLDFRVEPRATGYVVREVVIHRDGKRVGDKWVWTARPAPKPREVDRTGTDPGAVR